MTYINYKKQIEQMMANNYADFIKAMISIEKSVDDSQTLENLYTIYMERDDMNLLNDGFEEYIKG